MIFTYGGNADASPLRGCWWIKNDGGPRLKAKQTYLHSEGIPALKFFLLEPPFLYKLVAFCISKNCSLLCLHSLISHPYVCLLISACQFPIFWIVKSVWHYFALHMYFCAAKTLCTGILWEDTLGNCVEIKCCPN